MEELKGVLGTSFRGDGSSVPSGAVTYGQELHAQAEEWMNRPSLLC